MPNKLSKFWQELKRRKVIYVITVYASAAFVIIELANNVVEPLNLPERIPTIVILILAIGFPIAVLLSWIFDITPKGVEKTKPIGEEEESQIPFLQNRWKIATYISIVVIIGLIIFNVVGGSTKLRAGDIQSLVILPFENYTGNDQLEWFVSGMHASLIQDMGRISGYRIVNRTSSNVYKNVDKRVHEIASELGTDAAIEADVMCLSDSICLQIRVIRAFPEEETIWIANYKEDRRNILNLYNKITKQITDELLIELTPEEEQLLARVKSVEREAYDAYLKSHQYMGDLSEGSLRKVVEYLTSAIDKNPDWAPLYTGMASAWQGLQQAGHEPPGIALPKINEYLNKAIELDPNLAEAHQIRAVMAWVAEWDWYSAETEFIQTLASNPNNSLSRMWYALLLYQLQRPDEAKKQARLAYNLDPKNPLIQSQFALCLLDEGDCKAALKVLDDVLAIDPENTVANNVLEKAAFRCGNYERVYRAAKYHIPIDKESFEEIDKLYEEKGFIEAYEEILRRLEVELLTDFIINPVTLANKYHMVGQHEKALDWIEKGFELRDPNMPTIATGYYNMFHLYDSSRFIAILEKMNLPLPENW